MTLVCLGLSASVAHAQQWQMFPDEPRHQHGRAADDMYVYGPGAPQITPGGALGLSTISTLAPVGLGAAFARQPAMGATLVTTGILIGPSAGYQAAGLKKRGNAGVLLRTVFTVVTLSALVGASAQQHDYQRIQPYYEGTYGSRYQTPPLYYVATASAIVVGGSAIWDVLNVANEVYEARAKHRWIEARNSTRPSATDAAAGWSFREDADVAPAETPEPRYLPDDFSYLKQPSTWSFTTPTACK